MSYQVEFRAHVGEMDSPLGKVEVTHPIKQVYAKGTGNTDWVMCGYYFLETGHLSIINSKLSSEQVDFIKSEVAKIGEVKATTQAKPLVDEPKVAPAKKTAKGGDLEEAGL